MTYLLRYGSTEVPFESRTQAVRGMAREVRGMPLTTAERRAFDRWYSYRTYRSANLCLYNGRRYMLRVSIGGVRQTFTIDPPPPHTHQGEAPGSLSRVRVPSRDRSEAPDSPS